MAHKRGVERDVAAVFLSELARHGSVRKACKVAGVTRQWVRLRRRDDEDFALSYADAVEDSVDRLEDEAFTLALGGEEKLLRYLLDVKRYKKSGDDPVAVQPIINVTIGASQ